MAEPAARRRPSSVAWLVLLLIVVLGLVGASPFWAPPVRPFFPWAAQANRTEAAPAALAIDPRLGSIEATLKESNARLSQLEARPLPQSAPAPAPPPAAPDETKAISALDDQIGKLNAGLTAIGDRVAALESRGTAQADSQSDSAFLLTLADLRGALAGPGPFAAELDAVEAMAADRTDVHAALAALSPAAASGIPSVANLRERFERETAPAILRTRADAGPSSEDWGDWILTRLKRLIVIRRIDGATDSSDPVATAVDRAEAALRGGDLAGATAALDGLPPGPAAAASGWLSDARKRLAAEAALAKLWQAESARIANEAKP
jgi:hypothetical protein